MNEVCNLPIAVDGDGFTEHRICFQVFVTAHPNNYVNYEGASHIELCGSRFHYGKYDGGFSVHFPPSGNLDFPTLYAAQEQADAINENFDLPRFFSFEDWSAMFGAVQRNDYRTFWGICKK